jgi:O-acetyl-ADP-ribose deacetylase (regulator of RNase III)
MIVEYKKGDICDASFNIAHGVNCSNRMGAGVAKALYQKWPKVKADYHKYCMEKAEMTHFVLGDVNISQQADGKRIYNCFTQEYFGADGRKYVSYDAIESIFRKLMLLEDSIAIPKIGCGLAGGDWNIVSTIINEVTKKELDVYVYLG